MFSRHVALPGTYNVRDIGGYRLEDGSWLRRKRLFRGDSLHRVRADGRKILRELGIRTIIDLRGDAERTRQPDALGSLDVAFVELPIFSPTVLNRRARSLSQIYTDALDERPAALVEAVRALAGNGSLPALVHCRVGKDRTGMVIALLMSFLGVSDEDIATDYEASRHALRGAFLEELLEEHRRRGVSREETLSLLTADPSDIRVFLDHLARRAGSVTEFLERHGMTRTEMATLRRQLTTKGREPVAVESPAFV